MSKQPKIRFEGFSGDWEEKIIGEVGSVSMNRRIFKSQTFESGEIPFYKIGTFGGEPDSFISRELFEEYKLKYPYPSTGDILISASGSIGRTVEYKGKDEYFQDSNIVWLQHGGEVENSFLKFFYLIVNWYGLEGSTIKRLYNKNILNTKIHLPDKDEQIKIGNFFKNIDNLLTLKQCKYDKLVNVKKAMLEKMLPKEGEKIPKIRFDGFCEEWEERELNKMCASLEYGLNAAATEYDGINKYVRITDIDDKNHLFNYNDLTTPNIDLVNADKYKLKIGDILFARTGASVGKTYRYSESDGLVYYAGFLIRARIKPEINSEFIFQNTLTQRYSEFIGVTSQRSGQPGVNAQEYGEFALMIPKNEEQAEIGNFCKNLDNLIILQQQELQKLKNIKKSCLEKMFVS